MELVWSSKGRLGLHTKRRATLNKVPWKSVDSNRGQLPAEGASQGASVTEMESVERKGWDNYEDFLMLDLQSAQDAVNLQPIGTILRPIKALILGNKLGTKYAKNIGVSGGLGRF